MNRGEELRSLRYILLVLCFFFASNFVQAQEAVQVEDLLGTWSFDATPSFNELNSAASDMLSDHPALMQQIEASYIGKQLSFSADGNYVQEVNTSIVNGVWQLEEDTLTIITDNGIIDRYTVVLHDNTIALIASGKKGDAICIVPHQYFTKI